VRRGSFLVSGLFSWAGRQLGGSSGAGAQRGGAQNDFHFLYWREWCAGGGILIGGSPPLQGRREQGGLRGAVSSSLSSFLVWVFFSIFFGLGGVAVGGGCVVVLRAVHPVVLFGGWSVSALLYCFWGCAHAPSRGRLFLFWLRGFVFWRSLSVGLWDRGIRVHALHGTRAEPGPGGAVSLGGCVSITRSTLVRAFRRRRSSIEPACRKIGAEPFVHGRRASARILLSENNVCTIIVSPVLLRLIVSNGAHA